MSYIGVDIGTGSVRASLVTADGHNYSASRNIVMQVHPRYSTYITQSAQEILAAAKDSIAQVMAQANSRTINGIAFAATCSMVVYEYDDESGRWVPHGCDFASLQPDQNVILWMDSRAVSDCVYLNTHMSSRDLSRVGGNYIPEMGLPKLRWLSRHKTKRLLAFELHDWATYMFVHGTIQDDNTPSSLMAVGIPVRGALDGSFKGMDPAVLLELGINVEIGGTEEPNSKCPPMYAFGSPIDAVCPEVCQELQFANSPVVSVGCIDCYAGWLSSVSLELSNNPIYMIAGTSTCFLLPSESSSANTQLPGVWGPFSLFLDLTQLYECGQPATGKLFEDLFEEFKVVIESKQGGVLEWIDQETAKLEAEYGQSIYELTTNYFYYGDRYGNRCPYNDAAMGAMLIDGVNSSAPGLPSIWDYTNVVTLVIRYSLLIEFLCFQALDIIKSLNQDVDCIVVSGSQLQNKRLLHALAMVTKRAVYVSVDGDVIGGVARGSAKLAEIGWAVSRDPQLSHQDHFDHVMRKNNAKLAPIHVPERVTDMKILAAKHKIHNKMADIQRDFRSCMREATR